MSNSISGNGLRRLLFSHSLLTSGRFFFEIFLNIYIWKVTQNINLIVWFNVAYLFTHTVAFGLFSSMVKKGKVHLPRQIGLLGFALAYFFIFLLGDKSIDFIIPIGIVIGFVNGMYWISYQTLRYDLSTTKNRGNYVGMESSAKITVDIIMPIIGGAIIALDLFGLGYSGMFLIGTLFFLASFFLGNIKHKMQSEGKTHYKKTLKAMMKNKDIMKTMWSYIFGTIGKDGSLKRVILPLLIFSVLENELNLGGWLSFFSIIAIITSASLGKFVSYKHHKKFLIAGGIMYSLLISALILYPHFITYILFGTLSQLFILFIKIPKSTISHNLTNTLDNHKDHRIEYIVIREWFNIGFGRVCGFLILIFLTGLTPAQLKFPLLIIAASTITEVLLLANVKTDMDKLKD